MREFFIFHKKPIDSNIVFPLAQGHNSFSSVSTKSSKSVIEFRRKSLIGFTIIPRTVYILFESRSYKGTKSSVGFALRNFVENLNAHDLIE